MRSLFSTKSHITFEWIPKTFVSARTILIDNKLKFKKTLIKKNQSAIDPVTFRLHRTSWVNSNKYIYNVHNSTEWNMLSARKPKPTRFDAVSGLGRLNTYMRQNNRRRKNKKYRKSIKKKYVLVCRIRLMWTINI